VGPVSESDVQTVNWNLSPVQTSGGTLMLSDGTFTGSFQSIVPAPSGAAALGLGVAGVLGIRRRRQ
jgi:hypothetical protein